MDSILDKAKSVERASRRRETVQKIRSVVRKVSVYDVLIDLGLVPHGKRGDIGVSCPFHEEKRPSLYICSSGKKKGVWQCFGCGKKGDLVRLVMDLEDIRFPEAIKWLNTRSNGCGSITRVVNEILEESEMLRKDVELPVSKEPASDERDRIVKWLMSRRDSDDELAFRGESFDSIIDLFELRVGNGMFANRIVVPMKDLSGELIGYQGIATSSDMKRKVLNMEGFGWVVENVLGVSTIDRFGDGPLLIVEGAVDLFRVASVGYAGVSVGGKTLHSSQAMIVDGIAGDRDVVIVPDADEQGEDLVKSCESELSGLRSIKIARLPDGTDPADCPEYKLMEIVEGL